MDFPFDYPLVAPPNNTALAVLNEWVAARMPFVHFFCPANRAIYQRVRSRKNALAAYERRMAGPGAEAEKVRQRANAAVSKKKIL